MVGGIKCLNYYVHYKIQLFNIIFDWNGCWWEYKIEKNEFSYRLSLSYLVLEENLPISLTPNILVARRELAHELDICDSWNNVWKLSGSVYYKKAFNY